MGSTRRLTTIGTALLGSALVLALIFPVSAFATDPPPSPTPAPTTSPSNVAVSTAACAATATLTFGVSAFFDPNCRPAVAAVANAAGHAVSAVSDFTLGAIFKWVAIIILTIVNWLLIETSFLFNLVMVHLVFHFATVVGGSAGLHLAWGILRDIGNILLLFGFIFMGIGTILNLHHFNAKTALPSLIIFTVLLNFSLFAASAVIDSANLLSATFYNQVGGQSCDGQGARDCVNVGVSTRILAMSGINTENAVPNTTNAAGMSNTDTAIAYLGLALFNVVAAFVIGAGAIMLAIRAITLTFLMVLSPIGFAGMAIPLLHEQANDWWKRLINQSFFAPIYLLLIFVSLKIMESMSAAIGTQGQSLLGTFVLSRPETVGIIVIYVLTIGFMIGSLMVAKQMGAYGADLATSTSARMTTWPFGLIGRNTVGRFAKRLEHGVNETSLFGKERKAFYKSIAGSSMALRDIPGVAKVTGLDLGKTGKDASHGYHGVEEAEKKRLVEAGKNVASHEQEELNTLKYAVWGLERELKLTNDPVERRRIQDAITANKRRQDGLQETITDKKMAFERNLRNNPLTVLAPIISTGAIMKEAAAELRDDLRKSPEEKDAAKWLAKIAQQQNQGQQQTPPQAQPAAPAAPAAGGGGGGGGGAHCWVAREVYGANNPKWLEFRAWLHTTAPTWLWKLYGTYGERLAAWISDKPHIKSGIRVLMDAAVESQRRTLSTKVV